MTDGTTVGPRRQARDRRREVRRDLLLLGLAATLLFVAFLGSRDLWNPNEPIYGRAVVELADRGDWLLPTVNGEPFAEKPILYFVLARLAGLVLGGVDELAIRLPSAVAGIASVSMVYLLVLPYAGRGRARLAGALFGTTYIVFWSARSAQMDLLLTATALGAILAATRVLDHGWEPWRGFTLAGVATGLAVLTKGPVGLIVVALPVLVHAASSRRLGRLWHPALGAGAVLCLAVAVPWYAWLGVAGEPGLLAELLYRHNVVRAVDAWDHQAPWWYFLREFWNDMAPWSFFVPLALGLRDRDPDARRLDSLAVSWIVTVLVFFSIPLSKRSPYILPLSPAVAILVSGLLERLVRGGLDAIRRRAVWVLAGTIAILFAAAGGYALTRGLERFPDLGSRGAAFAWLLPASALAIAAALAHRRRSQLVPWTLPAAVAAIYLAAAGLVLPGIDTIKSPRGFCEQVAAIVGDRPLHSYGMWRWRAGYVYYLDRTIPRLETGAALSEYFSAPTPRFLLVEDGQLEEARTVLGSRPPVLAAGVGSKEAYLFGNDASVTGFAE